MLFGFLIACYGVSFVGSEGAFQGLGGWYLVTNRPGWAPPIWMFSPAWTVLYGLVAISGWFAWRAVKRPAAGFWLYWLQLALGGAWPWLFFARHLLVASAIEIVVQWALLLALVILFLRNRPTAGLLLVPYLLWVAYAAALNFTVWKMNSGPEVGTVIVGSGP